MLYDFTGGFKEPEAFKTLAEQKKIQFNEVKKGDTGHCGHLPVYCQCEGGLVDLVEPKL